MQNKTAQNNNMSLPNEPKINADTLKLLDND